MSPVTHRRGGRRHKGGRDTQRVDRFHPGVRGAAAPVPVWTEGVNFTMTAHSQGSGLTGTIHSQASNMRMTPGA